MRCTVYSNFCANAKPVNTQTATAVSMNPTILTSQSHNKIHCGRVCHFQVLYIKITYYIGDSGKCIHVFFFDNEEYLQAFTHL